MKSCLRGLLAALVLSASVSLAQDDGPPAGLLSHVEVGQRYTFHTNLGDLRVEEIWHVAEVEPERVRYLVTTRTHQGGKLLVEQVNPSLDEWNWVGRKVTVDAATLALGKSTQSRVKLEVPGAKLDCVATTVADAHAWTAVSGDFETFPGVVKVGTKEEVSRALVKVEEGPPPVVPQRAAQEAVEEGSNLPKGALDH